MTQIRNLDDIGLLREIVEVECKLAAGRDGQGQLPTEFWPTYSAFANTRGGIIILGLREKDAKFEISGIADPDKLRGDLFNQLNNRQKVSANLLTDQHVEAVSVDGRTPRDRGAAGNTPTQTRLHQRQPDDGELSPPE